jgi:16S rRNA (guanine966-N2)-methyltransferase
LSRAHAGEIRIIGGLWKRTKLAVPDRPGLRPTPDRVRETLFNWLGQDLTGWTCLDAFAGTGALGLEAASRGASTVTLIEADAGLAKRLLDIFQRLSATNVRVCRGDGVSIMRHGVPASLDLIFIDPPFDADLFEPSLVAAKPLLREGGKIYLEAPELWTSDRLAGIGLVVIKQVKAGAVFAHLLAVAP